MAAVSAELRFRDGQRQNISVKVENNLRSLINGINELNANVSHLLSQLVEREKDRGACAVGEEEEDDSEDDEKDHQNSEHQPPAKKSRT
ncbi:EKC/KEOPS complex subunit GON7 [Anabas testudineus]|uniref:EKC/KEOPS complex subunit GON7 n=1 Tax=Anabas testudineus TaxID=64144 RepID=UPI00143DFCC7|nr:EKC/KEOPS complex subunit GON7 [Anabas testudineus]